jgi:DNA-binding MarR family transcriptional regulator
VTELVHAVRRANVVLDAGSLAAQNRLGVSRSDLVALELLSVQSPLLVGEIAGELGISTGTATELVDRLVDRGLVTRAADPDDRRRTLVSITASGKRRFRSAFRERWHWIHEMASELSADDLRIVVRFLTRLHDIMPEAWRTDARSSVPVIRVTASAERPTVRSRGRRSPQRIPGGH